MRKRENGAPGCEKVESFSLREKKEKVFLNLSVFTCVPGTIPASSRSIVAHFSYLAMSGSAWSANGVGKTTESTGIFIFRHEKHGRFLLQFRGFHY